VIKVATTAGFNGMVGTSTHSLALLAKVGAADFDVIYLDYCGTPNKTAHFDPADDVALSNKLLSEKGLLVMTFSLRGIPKEKWDICVTRLVPTNMVQIHSFTYNDTSPMRVVILTHDWATIVKLRFCSIEAEEKRYGHLCDSCHRGHRNPRGHSGPHSLVLEDEVDLLKVDCDVFGSPDEDVDMAL